MGRQWKQWETLFWGSKITADGDWSHEIRRHLLFGKKAMTNLDSILKSRDITLSTKVCLAKAMVFPVVIYGCEGWTIKKAVLKNWCFWPMLLKKTLESPLDTRSSNQSILKEISPEYSLEGLQHFGHLMWRSDIWKDPDAGKDWRREEKATPEDEMIGWHHWLKGHEFEQALGVGEGQGSLVCCSPWGRKELETTEWLNWTELITHWWNLSELREIVSISTQLNALNRLN